MMEYQLLIDGRMVDGDATMDVINPATEQVIARCPRASEAQLEQAIAAARRAFPAWAAMPWEDRRARLIAIAEAIEANAMDIARVLTGEQGKPLQSAIEEAYGTAHFFRAAAGLDLPPRVLASDERRRVVEHRKPLGVVAAIVPWNFPLFMVAFKLPPALLAGNTVVLKPAPTTPLATLMIARLIAEIVPPGVVNVVTDANDLGARLASHPDVAKVSFTGSTVTGRKVYAGAAETMKRLTLELGGNDAAIALDDMDPAALAAGIAGSAFLNAGQVCVAVKRLYVPRRMIDDVTDALGALVSAARVGDGLAEGTTMGPIQNAAQYARLRDLLEDSRRAGRITAGGELLNGPGYFLSPTIVRDVAPDSRIVVEEQFGPILPVLAYDTEEEAIAQANGLPFGLGASVWGRDIDRAAALADRIDAGTVWLNTHTDLDPDLPFAGSRQSGLGVAFAEEGLAEYTQVKVINQSRLAGA